MAITPALLTSGVTNDLAGNTGTSSASITPTADALVLVSVSVAYDSTPGGWSGNNGNTSRNVFTLTGNGLTYVRVGTIQYGARRCTELFRAMGSSPSTGAISIGCADLGAVRDIAWIVQEFTGVITTGSDGADAVGLSGGGVAAARWAPAESRGDGTCAAPDRAACKRAPASLR